MEENNEKSKNYWINKLFSVLDINGGLNNTLPAKRANIISRYGFKGASSFESVVNCEIRKIRESIYYALDYSSERMLNVPVPKDKIELFEKVREHFSNAGYKTFYVDKTNVKELGDNKYLFISWDFEEDELSKINH